MFPLRSPRWRPMETEDAALSAWWDGLTNLRACPACRMHTLVSLEHTLLTSHVNWYTNSMVVKKRYAP